jgi:hypothetical protein
MPLSLLIRKGGWSANKFRISQIHKFADLNNVLDLRTFSKCGTLRQYSDPIFFCKFADLQFSGPIFFCKFADVQFSGPIFFCNLRICNLQTRAFLRKFQQVLKYMLHSLQIWQIML